MSAADDFIEKNKKELIKFLQLSRDSIRSQNEDNKVKDLIKQVEDINPQKNSDYNIYLEDPFGTVPF